MRKDWESTYNEIKKHLDLDNRDPFKGSYYAKGIGTSDMSYADVFSQGDIMFPIYNGHDTLALLPTSSGKSACFQGPALFTPGITLVISPLVSLIQNQVEKFNCKEIIINRHKILATTPDKGASDSSIRDFFNKISEKRKKPGDPIYKLIYVSPERLNNPKFRRILAEYEKKGLIHISIIVVDEAHCLSQSSVDFRESYLSIPNFIRQRPFRPTICAFTATATRFDIYVIALLLGYITKNDFLNYRHFSSYKIREEIIIHPPIKCHDLDSEEIVLSNDASHRPNMLVDLLKRNSKRKTIVFCSTVIQVDAVYLFLRKIGTIPKTKVHKYHAALTKEQRKKSLIDFSEQDDHIMIASSAFGLGVDIDSVSLIIHYDVPRSLEDYYQQIGRGARNSNGICCADCYIFIPEENNVRGSIYYTQLQVNQSSGIRTLQTMTIASRMKINNQKFISQINRERYKGVLKYLKKTSKQTKNDTFSEYSQKQIIEYLNKDIPDSLKSSCFEFLSDLSSVIKEVNELHIGNCLEINILRWNREIHDIKSEKINFIFPRNINSLNYFDMCVADAIYSLQINGKDRIYCKQIWEILTGDPSVKFSRANSKIEIAIKESIIRLSKIKVTILDEDNSFTTYKAKAEPILPLSVKQPEKGYLFKRISPLYRYSEICNGELIRVPVSLFAMHLHQRSTFQEQGINNNIGLLPILEQKQLKRIPLKYISYHDEESDQKCRYTPVISNSSFRINNKITKNNNKTEKTYNNTMGKEWPTRAVNRILSSADYSLYIHDIDNKQHEKKINAISRPWQATIENCVICHYLIHRISISRVKYRCDYINFDNMITILKLDLTNGTITIRERFCRKVLAMLSYFHQIGYVDFVAYKKSPSQKSNNLKTMTCKGLSLYKVLYRPNVSYWHTGDTGFIQFYDFHLKPLEAETTREKTKSDININELTGVKLQHKH